MRTIVKETNVFKFEELPENVKEKAVSNLYDINVDRDWWDCTYEDAANVGLKITEFDIERGSYCEGKLTLPAQATCKKIIQDHGAGCDTYKLAQKYLPQFELLEEKNEEGEFTDQIEQLEEEFVKELNEEYLSNLRKEYEYLTSEEAIIETINANEYEFTLEGKIYR